jgi:hypothetical protein
MGEVTIPAMNRDLQERVPPLDIPPAEGLATGRMHSCKSLFKSKATGIGVAPGYQGGFRVHGSESASSRTSRIRLNEFLKEL